MFGDGGRPIVYNLQCSGCESSIKACTKQTYPDTSCSRQLIAGVKCHGISVNLQCNNYVLV